MRYLILFEKGETSYGAYIPDLPGCVAVGATLDETRHLIRVAVELHLEAMHADGDPVTAASPRSRG
jgi:predicted RNase H-like HicB family nuclease